MLTMDGIIKKLGHTLILADLIVLLFVCFVGAQLMK